MNELWEKVHKIDKNVEVMLSKQSDILKILETHDKSIKDFHKLKYTISGIILVLSGLLSIITAVLLRMI